MPTSKQEETYYDILKVDPKSTVAEIVAAYHTAKNAFSRDSVATYSLFSPEEAQAELDKLEQAYLNLSNIDKKRAYDRALHEKLHGESNSMMPPNMTELERRQNAHSHQGSRGNAMTDNFDSPSSPARFASTGPNSNSPSATVENPPPAYSSTDPVTGNVLREIREKRSLSADDVSRITKIPVKFIQAIESEDPKKLPARVYLQGFIKNLATLYKLDPKLAAKSYLDYTDGKTQGS